MKILAKNGLTLPKTYLTDNIYKQIKKDLIILNPNYLSCVENGRRPVFKSPSGKYVQIPKLLTFMKEYGDRLELPRGYSYRLNEIFEQEIKIEYPYCEDVRHLIDDKLNVNLFDYQFDGISRLLQKQCGILSSPAASGKTVMGIDIVAKLGLKTLWITHLDRLMKQAVESLLKFTNCNESNIGIISQGQYEIGNVFTSAIVNTAKKYNSQLSKENFGLVIIDEAHHTPTKKTYDVLMKLSPQYLYGLSATPYRTDGLDTVMQYMIGPITEIKRENVIEVNKIVTPKVQVVYTNLSITTPLGSSYADFLSALTKNNQRNNIIVYEVIKEIIGDNICLILSDRVSHCELLYNKLVNIYPYVELVSGRTKKKEADSIIKKLKNREITALVSTYQFLSEGVDLPMLNRLFFTTPFKARIRTTQAVGRVQRIYIENKDAKIYDFVDENRLTQIQLNARLGVYEELGCKAFFKKTDI